MKLSVCGFDSFEKAKAAFRQKLEQFAFSKNVIFNKKGQITLLKEYVDDYLDVCEDEDIFDEELLYQDDDLTPGILMKIQNGLTAAFSGQDTKLGLKNGCYTDWSMGVQIKGNSVNFYGDGEGVINGYNPVLKTNIFSMKKEQNYYLYINPQFGQWKSTGELYMDLNKVEVD